MISRSPATSITVSTTLTFTDSEIPRRLIAATTRMKTIATSSSGRSRKTLK
jgi:hypothetical protein